MTGLDENRVDLHWSAEYSRNKISKEIYVTYYPLYVMSSETNLTQGANGETEFYDLIEKYGYEIREWGTENNLDMIGTFNKKYLCSLDNLPEDDERIFFSVTTQKENPREKIKDNT